MLSLYIIMKVETMMLNTSTSRLIKYYILILLIWTLFMFKYFFKCYTWCNYSLIKNLFTKFNLSKALCFFQTTRIVWWNTIYQINTNFSNRKCVAWIFYLNDISSKAKSFMQSSSRIKYFKRSFMSAHKSA